LAHILPANYFRAKCPLRGAYGDPDASTRMMLLLQAEAAVEPEAPIKPSEEDLWYRKMAEPMYFQVPCLPIESKDDMGQAHWPLLSPGSFLLTCACSVAV